MKANWVFQTSTVHSIANKRSHRSAWAHIPISSLPRQFCNSKKDYICLLNTWYYFQEKASQCILYHFLSPLHIKEGSRHGQEAVDIIGDFGVDAKLVSSQIFSRPDYAEIGRSLVCSEFKERYLTKYTQHLSCFTIMPKQSKENS